MKVSDKLSSLRIGAKMTMSEVGKHIGISQSLVNKYEKGEIVRPNLEILKKFAVLYGVNINELVIEEGLPAEVAEFISKPDALPFILSAYTEYKKYKEGLNSLNPS